MDCQAVEPHLSAWLDGQLEPELAPQVRDHLAACPGCWGELQALETVGTRLNILKQTVAEPPPAGLLAGVKALPAWLVGLAVVRRWLVAGGGVAMAGLLLLAVAHWSSPLSATLGAAGRTASTLLTPGSTLVAQAGQTVTMTLAGEGTFHLQGPGALVVRQAALGRLAQDERLTVELASGQLAVRFPPKGPAHDVRVLTTQAQIRLTGTWVVIQANPVATQVAVVEGQAHIRNRSTRETLMMHPGQMVQIQAGWLQVGSLPLADWLARKGVAAEPSAPQAAEGSAPTVPPPLQVEGG